MTATVAVITREADGVLTVPSAAFRYQPPTAREGRGWSLQNLFMPRMRFGDRPQQRATAPNGTRTLYILENGAPKAVQVKTGSTDGEKIEIISGLKQGDLVVTGARPAGNRTGEGAARQPPSAGGMAVGG
jgi:HlyD family secretion protein